jgi:selenocysteine-specific elongation factor
MRRIIIGTAGHIDHGKTALVKALTGIDTDRLQEEKDRGISIDLGFAHFDMPGGAKVGVVDVPGHERFIKNMLAGVGGIDIVLFVVACDEGIMPQTREHFDIVSLLGVRHALFALTKADMVDREMIAAVREEVEDLLRNTRFEGSPIVPTSVTTGEGLDELRTVLGELVDRLEERVIGEAVRLPIDRVFTMTGRGTVVTGTLWSGTVAREDRLEIEPGSSPIRVRSVEVHGEAVERAYAGQRTALGIHGVERVAIERGYCVVSPGDFEASTMLDVEFQLLPSVPRRLATRTRIRFHLGASEAIGRVFLMGADELGPGERGYAQVRLEVPVVAGFGDRFVMRTYSPVRTIGGGRVLDPAATGHKRSDARALERLKVLAGRDMRTVVEEYVRSSDRGTRLDFLRKKLSCGRRELEAILKDLVESRVVIEAPGGAYMHAAALKELEAAIEGVLDAYHAANRLTWGMPKEELRERLGSVEMGLLNWVLERLEAARRITMRKGAVRAGIAGVTLSPAEEQAKALVTDLLRKNLFAPPSEREIEAESRIPAEAFRKVIGLLIEEGEILRLEPGIIVHRAAADEAAAKVTGFLREHGEATASDLKGVLGTTRKFAVPLLEHLDRLGVTRRKGDKRALVK